PKEQHSKRLEDQAAERYRFILPRPEASVVPLVNVNPSQTVPQALVAPPDSKEERIFRVKGWPLIQKRSEKEGELIKGATKARN
ncbi:466_t:CDS:2, partial [Racocetra fulgida]